MAYGQIPFDKRIKDNIKNYKISNLFPMEMVFRQLKNIGKLLIWISC